MRIRCGCLSNGARLDIRDTGHRGTPLGWRWAIQCGDNALRIA
jgi:hypothetical protein